MVKRTFTADENRKIYFACKLIRNKLLMSVLGDAIKADTKITQTHKDIKKQLSIGSKIHTHITQYHWEELFKDKNWLETLSSLSEIFSVLEPNLKEQLHFIAEMFPKETGHALMTLKLYS